MEATEYLYTCAEIGVALAGFAALVVALSQKSGETSSETHYWYMNVIIERGLMASLLSMLPILLDGLGVAAGAIWLISSGLFALYIFWIAVRSLKIRKAWEGTYPEVMSSRMFYFLVLVGLAVMVMLLLHAAGVLVDQSSWWYVLAVTWLLASVGIMFFTFLRSVFVQE